MKLDKEDIARVMHQINKAYCESIGDHSQLDWDMASEGQKTSCIDGVIFHMQSKATPEESHSHWMRYKFDNGWRYGAVKDEEMKTHPCLVPYHQLPREQQTKDYLAKAVVEVLMDI